MLAPRQNPKIMRINDLRNPHETVFKDDDFSISKSHYKKVGCSDCKQNCQNPGVAGNGDLALKRDRVGHILIHELRWRWSSAHLAPHSLGFPSVRGFTCQIPAKIPVWQRREPKNGELALVWVIWRRWLSIWVIWRQRLGILVIWRQRLGIWDIELQRLGTWVVWRQRLGMWLSETM